MRRYILGGIAIVLIFAIAVYIFFYANFEIIMYRIGEYRLERVYGIAEGETLDLELYGIFEVDASGLRYEVGVVEGTPFTFFFQPHTLDSWKRHGNYGERNFDFSELNFDENYFQDRYLAVSFGREIAEIRRIGALLHGMLMVAVTFAEEYQGDVMFLYLMDEIPLKEQMGHEYFIMDGTERIFIGHSVHALNEYIPFP